MVVAQSCLARFKAERIDGIDASGVPGEVGTAVHYCIEHAYIASATGNVDQLDAALVALRSYASSRPDLPLIVSVRAEVDLRRIYHRDSRLWLRLPSSGDQMQAEFRWALDVDGKAVEAGDPSAVFAGRMDEVRWGKSGLQQRDWKNILAMRKKDDVKTDTQMRVYSLALLAVFPGAAKVESGWVMLKHDYEVSDFFGRDEPWHRATWAWMGQVRDHVLRAEADDYWPATPGEACPWCPIRHRCDALKALIDAGSVPKDGSPESIGRGHLALSKLAAQYTRAAKKMAEEADIDVGVGRVLGFKPGTKKAWLVTVSQILDSLRADDASDEDLVRWFPGTSITTKALEVAAAELLARGRLECEPYEYVAEMRESVPSVTFTTFPKPPEETPDDE